MIRSYRDFDDQNKVIREATETASEFSPYEELRKHWKKMKYGLRNLDSHLIHRERGKRPSFNHNMLKSMFIEACIEDNSMLKDNNWQYVFDNITGYNCQGEGGLNLVKLIVEKYKPTQEEIKHTVKDLISGFRIEGSFDDQYRKVTKLSKRKGNEIPAADYLITQLSDVDLKKMIESCVYARYQTDQWCNNWLVYKGYITCKPNVPRTYHANCMTALKFLNSREAEYSGWQLLKDPDCEFVPQFFETIKKHPNNGGINVSDSRFSKEVFQLFHIPKFKKYLEENPEELLYYEKIYNKFFHDPDEEKD